MTSGIWELPIAKDNKFLGGWQVNWLFQAQSGQPFTVWDCTNALTRCMRAIDASGITADASKGTATGNPNEFSILDLTPILGSAGSYVGPNGSSDFGPFPSNMTKRNSFRAPGRFYLDMSLTKRFRFGDHYALQLRAEAFNVLNHANLYVIQGNNETSFGSITGNRGQLTTDNRRVQLGAKFEF